MSLVADRFEIEEVAGKGGMGTVFRARDRKTDRVVALKIVEPEFANTRFRREAELLAELVAPAIVRYVAHGALDGGRMYLAMEWLEGTPLDQRLAATPLAIEDSLAVASRLAEALAAAHAKGIVHRDVKPANVILREGQAANATLVDFGIARTKDRHHTMTGTGVVIGTPAYMAPEQARAQNVDARADVFSLGCVLFECLCGRPAFIGEHVIAVLAKILLESPPRVRTIRPDVPAALDRLVARMLEKDPAARPSDGRAVARMLEAIASGSAESSSEHLAGAAVGQAESRLATVLLARIESDAAAQDTALANLTAESAAADAGEEFGVPLTALANGTLVGVVVASEAVTDAAERAARCALAMKAAVPGATIVLATGRAVVGIDLPVGTAIDEAAALLTGGARSGVVETDDATAALLETRFELARDGERIEIIGELTPAARVRTIAGREVPCIGREREVALLESTYDECIDEPVAQALLVVAPPGIGKSRVRRELVARLSSRAEKPRVWLGLADPVMAQSPFALASDLLRRALGIAEDEALSARREKVRASCNGDDRTAAFIGEIAGTPFEDAHDPVLRAARNNPGLLAAQAADAMIAFAQLTLEGSPLVIVLEDVHWADSASLKLFERLLDRVAGAPLFVLALARPSVDDAHPQLWSSVRTQRIALQPLLKKAAAKVARALLGEDADVDAIIDRAEGNALFIEELARTRLEHGARGDLPLTVMAAAEARITALAPEARTALRAAAVLGERFWRGAVATLVGPAAEPGLDAALDTLVRADVVSRSTESRFHGEPELVFRHAIVRDAAYAMLTDHDRTRAHGLAGEWLEPRIDDAVLLAHHFEVGARPRDAARWHVQAAENALAASAFDAVVTHARRAEALGIEGVLAGRAQLSLAHVTLWRGANPDARVHAGAAMRLLDRGSAPWFIAIGIASAATGKLENSEDLAALANELRATVATDDDSGRARAIARMRTAMQLYFLGQPAIADALVEGCEDEPGAAGDPHVRVWTIDLRFERSFAMGFPVHPNLLREGAELARSLGDERTATVHAGNHIITLVGIGAHEEAEKEAKVFVARGPRDGNTFHRFVDMTVRSVKDVLNGDTALYEEASAMAMAWNARAGSANRIWLAMLLFQSGRIDRADEVTRSVVESMAVAPAFRSIALAVALRIAVHRKDLARAEVLVGEVDQALLRGAAMWGRPFVQVACIEAHEALGHSEAARAALESGVAHLRKCADILEEWGSTFLHARVDSAELVAIARERGIIVE